ncbi:hypothetical protein C0J52_07819 [Blattella germanica]|nr:hypothetical protein C0J52_07819 [Blattella germanica]
MYFICRTIKGTIKHTTMNLAHYFFILMITLEVVKGQGQRVAPGVPPQQYTQQGQPQGGMPVQHQVPIQHQQVPVQHQQVPVQHQQMQQQIPVQHQQQVPGQQVHHGHNPHQGQLLNAANIQHEKQHIQEHMEVPIDTSKMSEQELQFHYFKMHDADNNNKLDGCELIKSLIHWHEQGHQDPNNPAPSGEKIFKDDELVQLIDPILNMDDGNNDGFIDYPEFVQAQQKAAGGGRRPS